MKVKCINDDFTRCECQAVKNILKVGDDRLLPKAGQIYEVIGRGTVNGSECYEIEGVESAENYGVKLLFKRNRFVTVDEEFVPNHYDPEFGLCRHEMIYSEVKINRLWRTK